MLAFFSTAGGAGTSVLVAAAAVTLSRASSVLVVDFGGDQAAIFGAPEPVGLRLDDWMASEAEPESLARLEVAVSEHISVLPGPSRPHAGAVAPDRIDRFLVWLHGQSRPVLIDIGCGRDPFAMAVLAAADERILVTRACYLALRRVAGHGAVATRAVVVLEPGRALGRSEVAAVLDAPLLAVQWDPAVARAVDAGLLASRLPRAYRRRVAEVIS